MGRLANKLYMPFIIYRNYKRPTINFLALALLLNFNVVEVVAIDKC